VEEASVFVKINIMIMDQDHVKIVGAIVKVAVEKINAAHVLLIVIY
jgi:hypothetical protein